MQLLSDRVKFLSCTAGLILFPLIAPLPFSRRIRRRPGSAKSPLRRPRLLSPRNQSKKECRQRVSSKCFPDDSIVFLPGRCRTERRNRVIEASIGGCPLAADRSLRRRRQMAWLYNRDLGRQRRALRTRNPRFRTLRLHLARENGKWKLLFDLGSDHPRPSVRARPASCNLVENHAPHESPVTALLVHAGSLRSAVTPRTTRRPGHSPSAPRGRSSLSRKNFRESGPVAARPVWPQSTPSSVNPATQR